MAFPQILTGLPRMANAGPMNYRHAYHAGNFADVVKHAVLALVLDHLRHKAAPFRVIDTHAGIGRYDLGSDEALRTGEWRDGIGRVLARPLPDDIAALLGPYLSAVAAENDGNRGPQITAYPGSPLIARALMRRDDQLVVNELHPADFGRLEETFARDGQVKVLALDAWIALRALLPPKERRGAILIDPPFEVPGEFGRLITGLRDALRRFATGVYILWYPIKSLEPVRALRREAAHLGLERVLSVELLIRSADEISLAGCGMLIVNPPYTVPDKLERLVPFLAETMAQGPGASGSVSWLSAS